MSQTRRHRFELQIDEQTYEALRRLAAADDRSAAAMVRVLIRSAAVARGLWVGDRPDLRAVKG